MEGRIIKALSGYYYVDTGAELVTCRARGKFRLDGTSRSSATVCVWMCHRTAQAVCGRFSRGGIISFVRLSPTSISW